MPCSSLDLTDRPVTLKWNIYSIERLYECVYYKGPTETRSATRRFEQVFESLRL